MLGIKRNIYLLYLINFLQGMVFYSSVSTLYRQINGLTLTQMGLIDSILSVLIFVFEVPWGMICDKIGYKKTLLICNGMYFLSKIIFWKADSFGMFFLERVFLAITVAGLSGCDSSFLYLSSGKEENPKVFGYLEACGTAGMMVAAIVFSIIIKDVKSTGLWTIFPYLFAFILTFFLQDLPMEKQNHISLKEPLKQLSKQPRIIILLIGFALISETSHTISFFYNQLQYQKSGIPIEFFGLLAILMTLVSFCNASIGKLVTKVKEINVLRCIYGLSIIACLGMMMTKNVVISIIGIAILTMVEGLYMPLSKSMMNKSVTTSQRVTMLSIYSMLMNLVGVGTNVAFGVCGDYGVTYVMALGAVFSLSGLFCLQIYLKIGNQQ